MKQLLFIFSFLFTVTLQAQSAEEKSAKLTIIKFFEAFHKQDTTALRTMVKGDVKLQSITTNNEGKATLKESSYSLFLHNIASIPQDRTFEEKLLDFKVQVDGNMANVWTPYEFWYQGKMSHCGVNSFQLMKDDNEWKIIYLVDTRRREGCK
tara:strand:+ start:285 stop:740 length:456 start_codon:yes stop_codon:yes gene_type:complete